MKTLFFMISAIGLIYLLVSSMDINTFSFEPKQTVAQSRESSNPTTGLHGDQLDKAIQDIEALSNSQRTLQKKLAEVTVISANLTEVVKKLEQKPDLNALTNRVGEAAQLEVQAAPSLMNASELTNPSEVNETPLLIAQTSQSESVQQQQQQKRMRQQAMLRDLAQKRQLAAISALQTSGN